MNLSCWTWYSTHPAIWVLAQSTLEERDEALRQFDLYILLFGAALTVAGITVGLVQVAHEMNAKPGDQSTPKKNKSSVAVAMIAVGLILLLSPMIMR